jgi:hypothetical protein
MVGKMLQKGMSVELGICCAKSFGEFEYGRFLKALSGHHGILNEKFENSKERTMTCSGDILFPIGHM